MCSSRPDSSAYKAVCRGLAAELTQREGRQGPVVDRQPPIQGRSYRAFQVEGTASVAPEAGTQLVLGAQKEDPRGGGKGQRERLGPLDFTPCALSGSWGVVSWERSDIFKTTLR